MENRRHSFANTAEVAFDFVLEFKNNTSENEETQKNLKNERKKNRFFDGISPSAILHDSSVSEYISSTDDNPSARHSFEMH